MQLSFSHPVFKLAPSVESENCADKLNQLYGLRHLFQDIIVRAKDPELLRKSQKKISAMKSLRMDLTLSGHLSLLKRGALCISWQGWLSR